MAAEKKVQEVHDLYAYKTSLTLISRLTRNISPVQVDFNMLKQNKQIVNLNSK